MNDEKKRRLREIIVEFEEEMKSTAFSKIIKRMSIRIYMIKLEQHLFRIMRTV